MDGAAVLCTGGGCETNCLSGDDDVIEFFSSTAVLDMNRKMWPHAVVSQVGRAVTAEVLSRYIKRVNSEVINAGTSD